MLKKEFMKSLQAYLSTLPEFERQSTLEFYSELIDDRMDEGSSEEEAIASLESPFDIASNLLDIREQEKIEFFVDRPNTQEKKKLWPWVLLAIITAPLWLFILFMVLLFIFFIILSILSIFVMLLTAAFLLIVAAGNVFVTSFFIFPSSILAGISHLGLSLGLLGLALFSGLLAYFVFVAVFKGTKALVQSISTAFENRRARKKLERYHAQKTYESWEA
ncbi:MAG: DUF1700 domain-containing protein [Coriobacteriia bacterium]|nr:DUF1700 domain-containing protein [Coriobacteriia bacterium]